MRYFLTLILLFLSFQLNAMCVVEDEQGEKWFCGQDILVEQCSLEPNQINWYGGVSDCVTYNSAGWPRLITKFVPIQSAPTAILITKDPATYETIWCRASVPFAGSTTEYEEKCSKAMQWSDRTGHLIPQFVNQEIMTCGGYCAMWKWTWAHAEGATYYQIHEQEYGSTSWTVLNNNAPNMYVSAVDKSRRYRACNESECGPWQGF